MSNQLEKIAVLAAALAEHIHREFGHALIQGNALINDVCPDCLAPEVYGRIHLGTLLHFRKHAHSDEAFADKISAQIRASMLDLLASPEGKAYLAQSEIDAGATIQ